MKVRGATFDGASVNQKLVRLHSRNKKLVHQILNPFSIDARQFFFFFDPPHLIKTTRNCWASKARTLWVNIAILRVLNYALFNQCDGKEIKWGHLWTLYNSCRSGTGLTYVKKLKFEHINLNSFSKMRVDLAAQVMLYCSLKYLIAVINDTQVLSSSVSKCLTQCLGPIADETARFTDMFDKFFDALNVSNFDGGKHERKPFKDPYRSASDFRLKVSLHIRAYTYCK